MYYSNLVIHLYIRSENQDENVVALGTNVDDLCNFGVRILDDVIHNVN